MADQYKSVSDSIRRSGDEISKAISSLSRPMRRPERRFVDPDLFTRSEVDELRRLSSSADVSAYSSARVETGGDAVRGFYDELQWLGLTVNAPGSDCIVDVLPMARWVVERRDELEMERRWSGWRGWLLTLASSLLSVGFGWVLGQLSAGTLTLP